MATTTNFGWPTPDNTSYVRNGASDMRTLGSAIDTSMADLKGGTAGQVLKKNTNTDMDFVWAAESGGISPTIFDAKGDLIGASAADTAARLAVGSNDQVLVADSTASTGLAWKSYGAQQVAGKNKILNGDFGINQRNFSSTVTSAVYGFDRWRTEGANGGGSITWSSQAFTAGAAPVSGYEAANYARCITASLGASNYALLGQSIEGVRTFAGQTVTVSFWAKAASGTPKIGINIRQDFGTGGSASVTTYGTPVTVGTSWSRYALTLSIPSIAGKTVGTSDALFVYLLFSDTLIQNVVGTQNNTFDIWGVQLEAGSVATPFTTATGNPASELAACQRYYYRQTSGVSFGIMGSGMAYSTTGAMMATVFPTQMRTVPTAVDYSAVSISDNKFYGSAITSLALQGSTTVYEGIVDATVASGLTAQQFAFLRANNNSSAYIGFSAEL